MSKPSPDGFDDDTPRAFRRLMQLQQKVASSRSNDEPNSSNSRKEKRENQNQSTERSGLYTKTVASKNTPETSAVPRILPNEKLSEFYARVDRTLPLSNIQKSRKPTSSYLAEFREERVTQHEKRLRRLQQQWREEEAQILERKAEEREQRETEQEEQLDLWKEWEYEAGKGKVKRGKRKRGRKGKGKQHESGSGLNDDESDDDDHDPWAKLNARARATKPLNLTDVVQAPPQLTKPREVFKVRGVGGARVEVANVPAAAGSLRRREELAEERKNVIEEYRKLVAGKRS
jgi:hypothetical protein